MDRSREMAITQMRRSIEDLGSSTEKCSEATLMRFLMARSMEAKKAAKMFVECEKWRAEQVPLGFIPESQIPDELGARKIYLQGGLSNGGFPVVIVKANKHYPPKDQPQFKKFVIHLLDKVIASSFKDKEIGNEKLIAIVDLQNISHKNIDARGFIIGFQFLQAYYPERLAKCYFINMPRFFVGIWKMISYFLDKATLEKIVIVSNEEEMKELVREVGEETLPEEYGGRAELLAIQDVVVEMQINE
ncbi:SEC14 cytosolic factor-like [Impatiens glandulifera]|uniref:SEC14 cytosolic factor-like n=1 Tax=Impatiens glandulifera TaxID=253017 RepID=UPI001FB07FF5|nr:SEC14 cytosolic factor-like [Impatiens glandulifera]